VGVARAGGNDEDVVTGLMSLGSAACTDDSSDKYHDSAVGSDGPEYVIAMAASLLVGDNATSIAIHER
jgi:hypothetical protein